MAAAANETAAGASGASCAEYLRQAYCASRCAPGPAPLLVCAAWCARARAACADVLSLARRLPDGPSFCSALAATAAPRLLVANDSSGCADPALLPAPDAPLAAATTLLTPEPQPVGSVPAVIVLQLRSALGRPVRSPAAVVAAQALELRTSPPLDSPPQLLPDRDGQLRVLVLLNQSLASCRLDFRLQGVPLEPPLTLSRVPPTPWCGAAGMGLAPYAECPEYRLQACAAAPNESLAAALAAVRALTADWPRCGDLLRQYYCARAHSPWLRAQVGGPVLCGVFCARLLAECGLVQLADGSTLAAAFGPDARALCLALDGPAWTARVWNLGAAILPPRVADAAGELVSDPVPGCFAAPAEPRGYAPVSQLEPLDQPPGLLVLARANQPVRLRLQTRDRFLVPLRAGSPDERGALRVALVPRQGVDSVAVAAIEWRAEVASDGWYELTVQVAQAGRHWLAVWLYEQPVGAGPMVLQVAAGPASSVRLLDSELVPSGAPLRLQALDAFGTPLITPLSAWHVQLSQGSLPSSALSAAANCSEARAQLPAPSRVRTRVDVTLSATPPLTASLEYVAASVAAHAAWTRAGGVGLGPFVRSPTLVQRVLIVLAAADGQRLLGPLPVYQALQAELLSADGRPLPADIRVAPGPGGYLLDYRLTRSWSGPAVLQVFLLEAGARRHIAGSPFELVLGGSRCVDNCMARGGCVGGDCDCRADQWGSTGARWANGSCQAAPAPAVIAAELRPDGLLLVSFSVATDQAGAALDCSRLFDLGAWRTSECRWLNSSLLAITLPPPARLLLPPLVLNLTNTTAQLRAADRTSTAAAAGLVPVVVRYESPVARVVAPQEASACGHLVLDARGSWGCNVYIAPLRFVWLVTAPAPDPDPAADTRARALLVLRATVEAVSGPILSLGPELLGALPPHSLLAFTLQAVCLPTQQTAEARIQVLVRREPLPTVLVLPAAGRRLHARAWLACSAANASQLLPLAWRRVAGPVSEPELLPAAAVTYAGAVFSLAVIEPAQQLEVRAGVGDSAARYVVTVDAAPEAGGPSVDVGDQLLVGLAAHEALRVRLVPASLPGETPAPSSLVWRCFRAARELPPSATRPPQLVEAGPLAAALVTAGPQVHALYATICGGDLLVVPGSLLELPPGALATGSTLLMAGPELSQAVRVEAGPDRRLSVGVRVLSGRVGGRVAAGGWLVLEAFSPSPALPWSETTATVHWSLGPPGRDRSFAIADPFVEASFAPPLDLTNASLARAAGFRLLVRAASLPRLVPVTFVAIVNTSGRSGAGQVTLQADSPPAGGTCSALPVSGALFDLACSGWFDPDEVPQPLQFRYALLPVNDSTALSLVPLFGEPMGWTVPRVELPAGLWRLHVSVCDAWGGAATWTAPPEQALLVPEAPLGPSLHLLAATSHAPALFNAVLAAARRHDNATAGRELLAAVRTCKACTPEQLVGMVAALASLTSTPKTQREASRVLAVAAEQWAEQLAPELLIGAGAPEALLTVLNAAERLATRPLRVPALLRACLALGSALGTTLVAAADQPPLALVSANRSLHLLLSKVGPPESLAGRELSAGGVTYELADGPLSAEVLLGLLVWRPSSTQLESVLVSMLDNGTLLPPPSVTAVRYASLAQRLRDDSLLQCSRWSAAGLRATPVAAEPCSAELSGGAGLNFSCPCQHLAVEPLQILGVEVVPRNPARISAAAGFVTRSDLVLLSCVVAVAGLLGCCFVAARVRTRPSPASPRQLLFEDFLARSSRRQPSRFRDYVALLDATPPPSRRGSAPRLSPPHSPRSPSPPPDPPQHSSLAAGERSSESASDATHQPLLSSRS